MNNENKNELTVQEIKENMITLFKDNKFGTALGVATCDTFDKTLTALNTAFQVNDKVGFATAKLFEKVNANEWFRQKNKKSNFVSWCKNTYNIGKTQAYNYIKACKLIDENGDKSILPHKEQQDFNLSQLVLFVDFSKDNDSGLYDFDTIFDLCKNENIKPSMSINSIKKVLNKLSGKLLDENDTAENDATENDTAENDTAENDTAEKTSKKVDIEPIIVDGNEHELTQGVALSMIKEHAKYIAKKQENKTMIAIIIE